MVDALRHMILADVLIGGKSSFVHVPMSYSRGVGVILEGAGPPRFPADFLQRQLRGAMQHQVEVPLPPCCGPLHDDAGARLDAALFRRLFRCSAALP